MLNETFSVIFKQCEHYFYVLFDPRAKKYRPVSLGKTKQNGAKIQIFSLLVRGLYLKAHFLRLKPSLYRHSAIGFFLFALAFFNN